MKTGVTLAPLLVGLIVPMAAAAQGVAPDSTSVDFSLLARPLNLKAGAIEASGRPTYVRFEDLRITGLSADLSFGLADIFEVGIGSAFRLDPDADWTKVVTPHALMTIYDTGDVDIGVSAIALLDFEEDADLVPAVVLGAPVRMNVAGRFALFLGHDAVVVGLGDASYVDLNVNVGFGVQLVERAAVRVDTQVVSLGASGDGNQTTSFSDIIPVALTGIFSINDAVDVHAGVELIHLGVGSDTLSGNAGILARF